jgi:membrane-associated phospholipid phosphatase
MMHPFHSAGWDRFFRWGTHLADGLVPTALALLLLLYKDLRSFLMLGLSCASSALVTQSLKHGPFAHEDRPFMFKEALGDLNWIADLDLYHHNSFPSGHATAAVSMCLALAILIGHPQWGAVLAFVSIVLAYSRVYLSQHFTADILAGGVIAVVVTMGVYHLLYESAFSKKKWLDRRVWRVQNQ